MTPGEIDEAVGKLEINGAVSVSGAAELMQAKICYTQRGWVPEVHPRPNQHFTVVRREPQAQ